MRKKQFTTMRNGISKTETTIDGVIASSEYNYSYDLLRSLLKKTENYKKAQTFIEGGPDPLEMLNYEDEIFYFSFTSKRAYLQARVTEDVGLLDLDSEGDIVMLSGQRTTKGTVEWE